MKIGENIKNRRKELGFTQEQLAEYLNISASAVNKWERGNTYPDITLLPALARLLKTDLNTLMAFQEDLTNPEINCFVAGLDSLIQEKGYEEGFCAAMDKIRDFPNCEALILNVALYLDGALSLFQVSDREPYAEKLERLYERLKDSAEETVRTCACQMLISRHMAREEYDQAEELLHLLPAQSDARDTNTIALKIHRNELKEASGLVERRLLKAYTTAQSALMSMMGIALREERHEDARLLAGVLTRVSELLGFQEFSVYVGEYELAVREKDASKCLALLQKILPAMEADTTINCPTLYKNLRPSTLGGKVLPSFIEELKACDFLRELPEFEALLEPYLQS